ncbi:hypothetical protein HB775_15850 [Rhizobium leguminosarum bv. trifolii]|nr:hypothetical protein HB775_15850 [Rhizobium leguminosarum bv. trifolii]
MIIAGCVVRSAIMAVVAGLVVGASTVADMPRLVVRAAARHLRFFQL